VVYICATATAVSITAALLLQQIGPTWLILVLVASFFGWVYTLYIRKSRYKLRVIKGDAGKALKTDPKRVKLVSFARENAGAVQEE
jgi:hypothetical protein